MTSAPASTSAGFSATTRVRSLAAAIGAIAVVGFGLSLSIPLLTFELERRGISSTWIGLNTAIAGIANVLTAPLVPTLLRRFGAVALLIAAGCLSAATLLGFPLAEPFWIWFPLRFALGAALCIAFVVSEYWINATAPDHRRGLVMGIYATALSLGFAAGPAALAAIGTTGWLPFAIGSGVLVAAMVPVALAGHLAPVPAIAPRRGVASLTFLAPSATVAAFVYGAVETGAMNFLPLFGLRRGLDEAGAGLLLSAMMLGNVAFQIPLGWLSDRCNRRVLLAGCGAVGALGALAVVVAPPGPALSAVLFVWGGVVAAIYTVGLAHLGARCSGAELAAANAAFVMLYSLGFTLGPPAMGAAMDAFGLIGFPVALAAALGLYCCFVVVRLIHRPERS